MTSVDTGGNGEKGTKKYCNILFEIKNERTQYRKVCVHCVALKSNEKYIPFINNNCSSVLILMLLVGLNSITALVSCSWK